MIKDNQQDSKHLDWHGSGIESNPLPILSRRESIQLSMHQDNASGDFGRKVRPNKIHDSFCMSNC